MRYGGGGGGLWRLAHGGEEPDELKLSWALLRRVAAYAAPYRLRISLMLVTMLITTALGVLPPLLYRNLIDVALPQHDYGRLNLLALGMVGIPIVSGLVGVLQRYFTAGIGEGIICDLRRALYAHMQRMSLRFFTSTKTGELMSRLNNDVVGAQQAVTTTLTSILSNLLTLISTLAIMLALEWRLTLLALVILPLFILPSRRLANVLRAIAREQLDRNAQLNAVMNETLNVSGALLVKLFGRTALETERFSRRAAAVRDIGVRQTLMSRWLFLGISLVTAVGTALVFWVGGQLVLSGAFTVGTIVAFVAYLGQLYGPLGSLTSARVDFATSMVSFERVFEVLDLPVEIPEAAGAVALANIAGRVTFDNVAFSYHPEDNGGRPLASLHPVARRGRGNQDRPLSEGLQAPGADDRGSEVAETAGAPRHQARRWALDHVSFEIAPGQLAALVGPSGAGKTTITYLLPRLYDPSAGRIQIDGHDLRDVTLQSLSEQIGMVTQETYLFHDTLRANLLYARPGASQAAIEAAARAANIHDFIAELPDGYETVVGERGYRLSGGEKQRVAIARVILKDPRILVLDEATSHLDSHAEALIQAALVEVMRGRTSLVIAHRLSTILAADVILVLNRGQLVEHGTHAELLARGGLYAQLYQTQFRSPLVPVN
jgi:ATP-binding cassette subfamily B protein